MCKERENSGIQHVFIIGSKGIPANYGGFETFVEKLTQYRIDKNIKYHVSCLSDNSEEFEYNTAHCFNIPVPNIGAAKAVYYDVAAFRYCLLYIENHGIKNAIVYVLACRVGFFIGWLKKRLNMSGGSLYVNPDGHEWMRTKWNWIIRTYWKLSERLMVKHAELLVCDSKNIERYIKENYAKYHPVTVYIAYGCDNRRSIFDDGAALLTDWYLKHGIKKKEYYLAVGRFVPENNYEKMIQEFMNSSTKKDFVLITNIEKNNYFEQLKQTTGFESDKRIKFVGTVYNQELLKKIRENAYGYLHGHSVGGTNPSLIEALGSTELNLLYDVGFNREVAEDTALYWGKGEGDLSNLLDEMEVTSTEEIEKLGLKAKRRIKENFSWERIVALYEHNWREI